MWTNNLFSLCRTLTIHRTNSYGTESWNLSRLTLIYFPQILTYTSTKCCLIIMRLSLIVLASTISLPTTVISPLSESHWTQFMSASLFRTTHHIQTTFQKGKTMVNPRYIIRYNWAVTSPGKLARSYQQIAHDAAQSDQSD